MQYDEYGNPIYETAANGVTQYVDQLPTSTRFGGDLTADANTRLNALGAKYGVGQADWLNALNAAIMNSPHQAQDLENWGPEMYLKQVVTSFKNSGDPRGQQVYDDYFGTYKAGAEQAQQADVKTRNDATAAANHSSGLGELGTLAALGGLAFGFASALGALGAGGAAGWVSAEGGMAYAGGLAADAAATGGMFVGSNGIVGGTGNALADAALNNAAQSAIKSTITGGDPGQSGVLGAVTGGFGAALGPLVNTGSGVVDTAIKGGATGALGATLTGGDPLTGAAVGAGSSVAGGLVNSAVGGGIPGAVAGQVAGSVVGGLIGSSQSPTVTATQPAVQPNVTVPAGSLGFGIVVPEFSDPGRRDMQWGTRLSGMT